MACARMQSFLTAAAAETFYHKLPLGQEENPRFFRRQWPIDGANIFIALLKSI